MKTIGVIGAGSMGSGIAQIAATNECKVLLFDIIRKLSQKHWKN